MEALPLKLHEKTLACLLPHQDHQQHDILPASKEEERADVYNVRLTCRRLCAAAWQAFVKILEDVPISCRKEGLHNLAALVKLPEVSNKLTCLTLAPFKVFPDLENHDDTLTGVEIRVRSTWFREDFPKALLAIVRLIPKTRHLVCLFWTYQVHCSDNESAESWIGWDSRMMDGVHHLPDPMHVS
jgi:hypothetical protein